MSTPSPGTRNAEEAGSEALFDELDALLQRMLALPVEPTDRAPDTTSSADDEILNELPLITVAEAAPLAYLESPPVAPPPARVEEPRPVPSRPARPTPAPPPPREPEPVKPPLASVSTLPAPQVAESIQPASEPEATPEGGPIAWLNDCFDRFTIPMGLLGRWLRLGFGRTLLGWAGLAMLAAAGGLLLWGCIDWTW